VHTGAFIFSLPQFIFGSYQIGSNAKARLESCDAGVDFSSDCTSTNSFALAFFFIGNILIGVGAAPLFTVGTAYLDDIVRPKHVPIHLGLVYLLTVVGPALGYGLGGAFLSVYVDPWLETDLQPEDPGWVGAWWLCFIFSAVVSWLLAIPFLLFPRLLPDSHLVKKERELEMAQKYKGKYGLKEDTDLITKLKSFPYHLKQVLMTLSWWFITAAICSSIIVLSGTVSFGPKYLESQFTLTASSASLISGGVGKLCLPIFPPTLSLPLPLPLPLPLSLSLSPPPSLSLSLSLPLPLSLLIMHINSSFSICH
jgi:organic anion transporter 4A